MRASEFIEAFDQTVIRMGRLSKDGRIVRILKHQDTVGFSPDQGWLLIDVNPGRRHPENIKWIPDTTKFDWVREFNSAEELLEISDERLQDYLSRANQQVDRRQERMARVRDRLNKGYEIYHAETPDKIVDRFDARTPADAQRYYADYVDRYESDVDYDLRLRRVTGLEENFADGRVKGQSRPGRVKRSGASCAGSVSDLRAKARKYSGEKGKMYHWCANMKAGKKKAK